MPALGVAGGRAGSSSSTGPGEVAATDRAPRAVVFILEQDAAVRDAVMAALEAAGVEARGFGSAEDFLDTELPARPVCLVIDVDLPEMGGLALIEALAERGTRVPAIITSGRLRPVPGCHVLLLEKPFGEDELIAVIRRTVALREIRDEALST